MLSISDSDSEEDLVIATPPPTRPSPPAGNSAPNPPAAPPSSSPLSRGDSFRLNEQQNRLMTSEIAGMIGSGSGGNVFGNNSKEVKVNGQRPRSGSMVNGSSKKKSREASPANGKVKLEVKQEIKQEIKQEVKQEAILSKDELRSVMLRNQNMRQMIFKEVKRPGKDHEKLFTMLRGLHGPRQIRMTYIGDVILEAKRFRRKVLAEILEQKMDELISVGEGGSR